MAAALAGLGIAMLPNFLTDPHVATGAWCRFSPIVRYLKQVCSSCGRQAITLHAKSES
jgi:DNA-binding transcriptional LysR family regulator